MKFHILPVLVSVAPKVVVVHASHARAAALPTIHHGDPMDAGRETSSVVSDVEHDRIKLDSQKGSANMRALQINAPNANFTITDPNGSANDNLGCSVDIHGNDAIIGVRGDDNGVANPLDTGSARVYKRNGTTWVFDQKLTSSNNTDTRFGSSVAVHGDNTFVAFTSAGGGFEWFQRNASLVAGNQWEFKQRLTGNWVPSSFGDLCVGHGGMVFDGSKLVCGDFGGPDVSGQGYVFALNQTSELWEVEGILQPDTNIISYGAECGESIAISGDKIVMGCKGQNEGDGTAFVFVRSATVSDNGGWGNGTELTYPNAENVQRFYGTSVGIDGDKIIVGADKDSTSSSEEYGAAYIWKYEALVWSIEQRLLYSDYNGAAGARYFGWQVAILGGKAIVTSLFDDITENGVVISNAGAVRVFQQDSVTGNWTMDEVIHSSSPQAGEYFGDTLGWDGTNVIIGAQLSDASAPNSGAAYIHPIQPATPGPWEVEFRDMVANFTTTSDNEITASYHVGVGRTIKTFLYQKGCKSKTPITDIQITSTNSVEQYNSTFDTLTVGHSIDKSLIANSTQIWNSTSNILEVCQVVELREGDMIIITNEYELLINFDLVVDYNTGNITLDQADTLEESAGANVNDYISAFKCDGEQFAASTTPHLENTQLNICIESESTDVVIDKVKTMIITQVVDGGSDATWTIIDEDETVLKDVTSKTHVTGKGVYVTTYVPASTFSYRSGNSITVSGQVELLLGNGRKLKVNIDSMIDDAGKDRSLQVEGAGQAASFGIDVALEPQAVGEDVINSATRTTGMKVFAGLVFALIYSMW